MKNRIQTHVILKPNSKVYSDRQAKNANIQKGEKTHNCNETWNNKKRMDGNAL
jgi:formylmethanofuran:tetrahydromethanopterin formyltransferase